MIFTIYADDEVLHDPRLASIDRAVVSPKLTLELNKSGSLTFTLPPSHALYNSLHKLKTIVRVYRDGTMIFKGRIINDDRDFYKRKNVYCEGALSFFIDSQMRPYNLTQAPSAFLSSLVTNHNSCVDASKRFTVGRVTVAGTGAIKRTSLEYRTTLDILTTDLTGTYGGYLNVREENGTTYIDYLSANDSVCSQVVEFGKNLMDLTETITAQDVFTVLIPLGAQTKDSNGKITGRVTISSVNNGHDYLENQNAISLFGRIEKVQTWDKITTPAALLTNAQKVMAKSIGTGVQLNVKAVDLKLINSSYMAFDLGQLVRVKSKPHGIDTVFQITKIDYDCVNPDQTEYTFTLDYDKVTTTEIEDMENPTVDTGGGAAASGIGTAAAEGTYYTPDYSYDTSGSVSLSQLTSRNLASSGTYVLHLNDSYNSSLEEARSTASSLINNGLGGYVCKTRDEIFIMDTDDIFTATKVWRWNKNGFGYWHGSPGGGAARDANYTIAITSNGEIVADFITTGELNADVIKAETITADKVIVTDDDTAWLEKINEMVEKATDENSGFFRIGGWKVFGRQATLQESSYMNYVRFAPYERSGFSVTFYPAGFPDTISNTLNHGGSSVTKFLEFALRDSNYNSTWCLTKEYGFIQVQQNPI